ncbi:MAG: hypothetical protein WA705_21360, partial [Candidatus Ozemobacteraceae bacterium]
VDTSVWGNHGLNIVGTALISLTGNDFRSPVEDNLSDDWPSEEIQKNSRYKGKNQIQPRRSTPVLNFLLAILEFVSLNPASAQHAKLHIG